jgi:serine/threonine-protein kinase
MLARQQRSPRLRTALAAAAAALALWACSGEVIPPGGDPGPPPPGAATGPDGGNGDGGPGGPDGGKPDGGPADAGGPGGDAGAGGDDRFPGSATLYRDVSGAPLDPSSAQIVAHLADAGWGTGAMQIDFSFDVLHADSSVQPRAFTPAPGYYSPDCDRVPVPVPSGGAAEGSSTYACDTSRNDCHLLVYQGRRLYELYQASISGGLSTGSPFTTVCAVVWDLDRDYWQPGTPYSRGDQCTSADAAGLPIAPLLVTGAELQAGVVPHALRFILPNPRMAGGVYVHPATHAGGPSGDALYPPYGARFRLRSSFDLSRLPNAAARAVAVALQTYGMILADGGNVPLTMDRSAAAYLGPRDLALLQVSDFEMVAPESGRIPLTYDCTRTPVTQ